MAERKVNPGLKLAIELVPIAAFFIAYFRLKGHHFEILGTSYNGFILATAGFIPLMLISTGLLWWLTGKLSKMQIVSLVLVIVFGGLSVWFNDERFFKMKPTIIYLLFAGTLGFGLMRGQSYLRFAMGEVLPLAQEGWMILTRRLAWFFFLLAVANELVWRTMPTPVWVTFKTFVLSAAIFVFFIGQKRLIETYARDEED